MEMGAVGPQRYNSVRLGVQVGMVLPLLILGIILLVLYIGAPEGLFRLQLFAEGTPSRLLSLATLANAVLFFIAIRTNRLYTARGLLGATIVYAIFVFILNFLY